MGDFSSTLPRIPPRFVDKTAASLADGQNAEYLPLRGLQEIADFDDRFRP